MSTPVDHQMIAAESLITLMQHVFKHPTSANLTTPARVFLQDLNSYLVAKNSPCDQPEKQVP
jgi:hypothetical protein